MIKVKINENCIHMEGHAGYHIDGHDIVCAAVSALTCSLVNSLQELAGVEVKAEEYPGYMDIQWEEMNDQGRILVDSWFLGVTAINQKYSCIQFIK